LAFVSPQDPTTRAKSLAPAREEVGIYPAKISLRAKCGAVHTRVTARVSTVVFAVLTNHAELMPPPGALPLRADVGAGVKQKVDHSLVALRCHRLESVAVPPA
jgi:hypothetical protein